ncbi:MAG: hypothetical protein SW019_18720 [Actinomycetota bacterium]|nr:hypothetical protein [Actinomycetota bacterium]
MVDVLRSTGRLIGRHWLLSALVLAGVVLRVLAWFAYQPALLFIDSFRYLGNLYEFDPSGLNPIGYELFVLTPVLAVGGLELVTAIQHLAGVLSAVALAALALRHGVNRWWAAVAAAPLLLDGYQIQIEQLIMSDAWQQVLLVALLWVLLGTGAPNPRRAALAGLLVGMAVMLRLVALALVVPILGYLLIAGGAWRLLRTRVGWRTIGARTAAFALACAAVLMGYATYFQAETGQWGLTRTTSQVLFGRAAVIADCDTLELDDLLERACPTEPLGERRRLDDYAHIQREKGFRVRFPSGTDLYEVQREFGWTVIAQQPLDFAAAVAVDFGKGFRPTRIDADGDVPVSRWQFQLEYPNADKDLTKRVARKFSGQDPETVRGLASFLRGYQLSVGYTPGPLLAVFGVIALLAGLGVGRARRSGIRSAILLALGMALTMLLLSAAFEFSWRYQLPALVLLPFAGVLGITAIWRRPPAAPPLPGAQDWLWRRPFSWSAGVPVSRRRSRRR